MAVHRPLGRPGLEAGSRKNALLLLAVLLCFQPFTPVAARVMARTPELETAAGQTTAAQSAAGKPQPQQAPKQQPTAAPPAAAAATDAQQQERLAASRQARAAAQGRKQPGAPLPVSAPTTTAAAKRESWKAAFRARQAAGAAAASKAAVASAGAEEPQPRPQVGEDLPELIPLPLLFGESKYTNPQVWWAEPVQLLRLCPAFGYALTHMRCVLVCVGCQPAALKEGCQCDSAPWCSRHMPC